MFWKKLFRQGTAQEDAGLDALKRRVAELERQLMTDERTGIPSKQHFFAHYRENAREGDHVLFLDLDDFKSVNDSYGHQVGDALLRQIAQALFGVLQDKGFVARLSGDEFLAHLPAGAGDIEAITDALMEAVQRAEVELGELRVSRRVSVGMSRVTARMDATEAIVAADRALLTAKQSGRNRSVILREREANLTVHRPSLEEVRLALQRNEIGYHVQPIVDLGTMQPEGYEALLRWSRPNGEVVGPAYFLETMTGAYDVRTKPPLEAAHRTAAWAALEQGCYISFNISTAFLNQIARHGPGWVSTIVGDIPPSKIVLELVETIIDREADAIAEVVSSLRKAGIRVALDDFGMGRSTLERFQRVPVDIVKIDKHFLHMADRSSRDMEILKAMIDLTRSAEATCVVEGIETQNQLELVQSLGAEWGQGFLLGRPAPTKEFGAVCT